MHQLLTGIEGVTSLEPQGAFYAFPNLSHYLDRPIRGRTSSTTVELCGVLLDEAKVAIVPGEAFDAPGLRAPQLRPGRRRPRRGLPPDRRPPRRGRRR